MEVLLDRMQVVAGREALNGGDLTALRAEGRHQAGVDRLAVEPHGTGAAVALIAALLDAEHAIVTDEGAQTLARLRRDIEGFPVDRVGHDNTSTAASSARICSAK